MLIRKFRKEGGNMIKLRFAGKLNINVFPLTLAF